MRIRLNSRSISRGGLRDKKQPGNFYLTTRGVLIFSRIMGFLPLTGLTHQSSDKLRYTLWSPYTIYYAFSMFGQILLCLSAVYQIFQKGVQLGSMFHFIFYGSNLAAALILARNAYNWPSLIKSIEEIENQLPYFRRNFRTIITLTTALMLANCAVEHILFVAHGLIIAYSCDPDNVIDIYLKLYKASIYEFTRGSAWRWVVTEIFTLQGSFNYSYNDFIMVLVSLYLSEYFLVHNKRLKKAVQQEFFECENLRLEYLKIVHLVKLINVWFGICLLASVTTNLFSVCIQLFYVISDSNSFLEQHYTCKKDQKELSFLLIVNRYTYFGYSLLYIILRTTLVLVLSARVYTNGAVPVYILQDLPTFKFSTEVQRYIDQVKAIKIAISGLDFFYVTRGTILTVYTTIVTYEVILLEFYKLNNWI